MEVIQTPTAFELFTMFLRAFSPFLAAIGILIVLDILLSIFEPDPDDKRYKKKAETGAGIVLTCDQYLALHEADPERYPVDTSKIWKILRDHESKLHMNQKEYQRLFNIAYQKEEDKELKEAQTECLDELYHMQDVLGQLVKVREKESAEAVAKASAVVKQVSENLEQAGA